MAVRLNAKLFSTQGILDLARRGQENKDYEFSQTLHIDLRYVFNGFDLGIEEDVAQPLNFIR